MTDTEKTFQRKIRKRYPGAYIKKLPDYKTGAKGKGGWPDYLFINEGKTVWFEVKSGFGDTITLTHFTDAQKVEFPKMMKSGAVIMIYAFTKTKGEQVFDYKDLLNFTKLKFEKLGPNQSSNFN